MISVVALFAVMRIVALNDIAYTVLNCVPFIYGVIGKDSAVLLVDYNRAVAHSDSR